MDLAVAKAVFDWVKLNREGFWQGAVVLLALGGLWVMSKLVGRGKAIAGGVLDTYNKMTEDLKQNIADERAAMAARLELVQKERDQYLADKQKAEELARTEGEKKLALLVTVSAIKEALAKEGEVVVTNPDGTITIKPSMAPPTKEL